MIVMEHVEDAVTPVVQISDSIRSFFRFAHFVCRPCPALSGLLVLVPLSAWSACWRGPRGLVSFLASKAAGAKSTNSALPFNLDFNPYLV